MQREDARKKREWLVPLAWALLETMLWQQFVVIIGLTIYACVLLLALSLSGSNARYRRPAYYASAAAVCVVSFWFNNRVWAPAMAETIGEACVAYKAEHGQYPSDLDQLVPQHLPVVPPAKFAVAFSGFSYMHGGVPEVSPSLYWVEFPPFGRPTYSIEREEWGYVD